MPELDRAARERLLWLYERRNADGSAFAAYREAIANAGPQLIAALDAVEQERDQYKAGCNPICGGCGLKPCNEHGKAVLWCDECVTGLTAERDAARAELAKLKEAP